MEEGRELRGKQGADDGLVDSVDAHSVPSLWPQVLPQAAQELRQLWIPRSQAPFLCVTTGGRGRTRDRKLMRLMVQTSGDRRQRGDTRPEPDAWLTSRMFPVASRTGAFARRR
jgi:hypothetical protein